MRGRLSGGNRASRLYFDEGWTIYDVSLLLGHADVKTTSRYAHLADDPVKRAADAISKSVQAAFATNPSAEVIAISAGKRRQ